MSLKAEIIKILQQKTSISVEDYINFCLYHPTLGYYSSQDIFGQNGDFITAPEISQTFGEMLALWIYLNWQNYYKEQSIIFCEMGPGRGTLSYDIINNLSKLAPEILSNNQYILIETSAKLTKIQQEKLAPFDHLNITWHKDFSQISKKPLILFANELLDALAINQYQLQNQNFYPRKIILHPQKANHFTFADNYAENISNQAIDLPLDSQIKQFYYKNLKNGSIIEYSTQRIDLIKQISAHLAQYYGMALFIDYGELKPGFGDTLQAVRQHKYEDIFANPGLADLSSQVDFYNLAKIANQYNCLCYGKKQGDFLSEMGIIERAKLLASKNPQNAKQLFYAIDRLINKTKMGELFKVMAITAKDHIPFGFSRQHII